MHRIFLPDIVQDFSSSKCLFGRKGKTKILDWALKVGGIETP